MNTKKKLGVLLLVVMTAVTSAWAQRYNITITCAATNKTTVVRNVSLPWLSAPLPSYFSNKDLANSSFSCTLTSSNPAELPYTLIHTQHHEGTFYFQQYFDYTTTVSIHVYEFDSTTQEDEYYDRELQITMTPIEDKENELLFDPAPVQNMTVSVDGTEATAQQLEAGKIEGVETGSPVTLTPAEGYTFRNLEVKPFYELKDALVKDAMVTIKTKYSDENTLSFSCNGDGTYTFVSGVGVGSNSAAFKELKVDSNGNLVYRQCLNDDLNTIWNDFGFSITFNPSTNTYSLFKGNKFKNDCEFRSIVVNDVDITDQLSAQ